MKDDKIFLNDIINAIDAINKFVDGISFEQFKNNDLVNSAVIRKFEIIGEASKNISDTIKNHYPDIPWKNISGMRDKLIHVYFSVDYKLVWDTIKNALQVQKNNFKLLIEELNKQDKKK